MPCPVAASAVPSAVPPPIAVAGKEGFDQWLDRVLGFEREAVIVQFQELISKHLELHHAELIAQIDKQLAVSGSQDLRARTEHLLKGNPEHGAGLRPDTGTRNGSSIQAQDAPIEDTHAVSDVTWLECGALGTPGQKEPDAAQKMAALPDSTLAGTSLRATSQETDVSAIPSGNAGIDAAYLVQSSKSRPPCERKASLLIADEPVKSPSQGKLSYKSQRLAALARQDQEGTDGGDCLLRLVNSTVFEFVIVVIILFNCVTVMIEAQFFGYNIGYNLGYPKYTKPANEVFPGVNSMLKVAPIIFTVIFLIELFMRIGAYKQDSWRHPILAFDMLLILVSGIDVVAAGLLAGVNPTAIRCFRVLKLLRMVKILRRFSWMSSLFLIVRSIKASVNALLWSLTLLALLQTCVGLGLLQVLHIYLEDTSKDLDNRKLVFEYFGTFSRTFVTMFEISIGNWAPVCRALMEAVSEWFGLFFILYSCALCFAVVNVIRAVFIAETARIAAADDEIAMMRQEQNKEILAGKLKDFFEELDESGDGVVNRQEFDHIMTDAVMQRYLSSIEVDVDDVRQLFRILDDGDGNISCDEFCKGIVMVKGQAKAIDMVRVSKCVRRIEVKMDATIKQLTEQVGPFKPNGC